MSSTENPKLVAEHTLYAVCFDGKGNAKKLQCNDKIPDYKLTWLHFDYEHPVSANWLRSHHIIPEVYKDALIGGSQRPRMAKIGDSVLLTLKTVNLIEGSNLEELVTVCIYLDKYNIVSTQNQFLYGINELIDNCNHSNAPTSIAGWLVQFADILTDNMHDYIEDLYDRILACEDTILSHQLLERGQLASIRRQLIVMRRYMSPQRNLLARISHESFSWWSEIDKQKLNDIIERLGRDLDDLDAYIARTTLLADEVSAMMTETLNQRIYIVSILTVVFLPMSFLTGLLGVNLGGIPGSESPYGFMLFTLLVISTVIIITWWVKRQRWL